MFLPAPVALRHPSHLLKIQLVLLSILGTLSAPAPRESRGRRRCDSDWRSAGRRGADPKNIAGTGDSSFVNAHGAQPLRRLDDGVVRAEPSYSSMGQNTRIRSGFGRHE